MTDAELIQSLKAKAEQAIKAQADYVALTKQTWTPGDLKILDAAQHEARRALAELQDEATPDAILRLLALVEQREKLMTLAREAANGWACYAKRKIELDDIGRIHQALDALRALQPPKE